MPHEITVPLQEIKAVLAGTRRVQNDLRTKAYWGRVSKAGLEATLQTGSDEIILEVDVDAYSEPSPNGSPMEVTHRFQGGLLSRLGVPEELLLRANLLRATVEARTVDNLSSIVQKGIDVGQELTAVATLQSATRTAAERTQDIQQCAQRIKRSTRALDSRSQQLLTSSNFVSRKNATQILHRRNELAARQHDLNLYHLRQQNRLETAQQRIQESGLPEVVTVAAIASGLRQAGQDVEVEADGATLVESIVLHLADKIAFR